MNARDLAQTTKTVVTNNTTTPAALSTTSADQKACDDMRNAINKSIFAYQIIIGGLGLLSLLLIIVYVIVVCYFRKKMHRFK